jgi:phosphoglycolate phosphatase-like HAD superfamily hydrolase
MPAVRAETMVPAVLVLFDIDGTLIRTAGAGVRGMNDAFERLHGRRGALQGVPVSGRTDRAILSEVFSRWNEELTDAVVAPLRDLYFEELARELQSATGPGFGVLPGVHEALDALEGDPAFAVGLLTGNFERGAAIKLAHFDLWRRFRFGAFGDEHTDRRALVPVAMARARALGIDASHVVVIGDTPLDVDCAHAHGARAVAVATGEYSLDDLAATGAEIVVDTRETLHPITERLAALCAVSR